MMYRLDIDSPQGASSTFEIFAVTLESAQRAAVEAQQPDFAGVCSLTLRAPHQPDLMRRCDSPRGPWYWLRAGGRLPADVTLNANTLNAWGAR